MTVLCNKHCITLLRGHGADVLGSPRRSTRVLIRYNDNTYQVHKTYLPCLAQAVINDELEPVLKDFCEL